LQFEYFNAPMNINSNIWEIKAARKL